MSWSAIAVSSEVKAKLYELREVMGAKSPNEVISRLIQFYITGMESRIRDIMCRELADQTMTLSDWIEKLKSYGLVYEHLIQAVKYLKGDITAMSVDPEKCK